MGCTDRLRVPVIPTERNVGSDLEAEGNSAYELSKKLSGHVLSISHMADLIYRRSWSIAEFMNIYLKNARRAHNSELQAVWDFSFKPLETDSVTFLGIASCRTTSPIAVRV